MKNGRVKLKALPSAQGLPSRGGVVCGSGVDISENCFLKTNYV